MQQHDEHTMTPDQPSFGGPHLSAAVRRAAGINQEPLQQAARQADGSPTQRCGMSLKRSRRCGKGERLQERKEIAERNQILAKYGKATPADDAAL